MHIYCKLKSGEVVIIWSDNVDEKTILAYPVEHEDSFNVKEGTLNTYSYSEIEKTVTDLSYLQKLKE